MSDISGTTALVTGASRGFGQAIAEALVGSGAKVVGVARDRQVGVDLHPAGPVDFGFGLVGQVAAKETRFWMAAVEDFFARAFPGRIDGPVPVGRLKFCAAPDRARRSALPLVPS